MSPWFRLAMPASSRVSRSQTPRDRRHKPLARFVPRLEALEDRCLLSVIPTVAFIDGTVGQTQWNSVSDNSQPVRNSNYQANISVTIAYSGSAIGFVSLTSAGSVGLSPTGQTISNATQISLVTSSGNASFLPVQTANQVQDTAWQYFQFQLSLSSNQNADALTGASYSVSLSTLGDTALKLKIVGPDATSGNVGTSGLITISGANAVIRHATDPHVSSGDAIASGINLSFSNPTGPSTITITLTNLSSLPDPQSPTPATTYAASYDAFATADGNFNARVFEYKSASPSLLGGYFPSGSPIGQTGAERRTINSNSLVVAEIGSGFYLTLSMTQEISQRSSSAQAQATWTGLRPPLETPLAKPESGSIKVGWWSSREETNSTPGTIRSFQLAETNSHTMENMVASILLSLQLTEADHQVQDMAQAAEPWADLFGKSDISTIVLGPGEQRPASLGDVDNSLDQLLEGMALNEAVPLSSEMHVPEQNAGTAGSHASNWRKAASGWGWRVLWECMATVLLALYWPGAIWPQTPQLAKRQRTNQSMSDKP
jgi:hypothetical protein